MSIPHLCFTPFFLHKEQVSIGSKRKVNDTAWKKRALARSETRVNKAPVSAEAGTEEGWVFPERTQKSTCWKAKVSADHWGQGQCEELELWALSLISEVQSVVLLVMLPAWGECDLFFGRAIIVVIIRDCIFNPAGLPVLLNTAIWHGSPAISLL